MNREMRFFFVFALSFLIIVSSINAKEISVKKRVGEPDSLSVDKPLTIFLEFDNPFEKDVPLKIVDKNIVGQNGVDIQCLEYTLPAGHQIIGYDEVQPFAAGDYTLDAANITYTNPETNKEESVKSNSLTLNISKSAQGNNVITTGITTIYQCNGQTIRSTRVSSQGTQTSIQISSGGTPANAGSQNQQQQPTLQQQIDQMKQQAEAARGDLENRMQNNQQGQDMNSLKQQMAAQQQEQQQMDQQLKQNVANDSEFQQMEKELSEKGYKKTAENFQSQANDSGKFASQYQNEKGEQAQISGEMKQGEMTQLNRQSKEDQQRIQQALQNSKEFNEMKSMLESQNYSMQAVSYSNMLNNRTEFKVEFNSTNQGVANITGNIQSDEVKDLKIEKPELNKKDYIWLFWFIPLIILIAVAGYYLYKKFYKKPIVTGEKEAKKESTKPINFKKEALEMLLEAVSLFENKKSKEAYTKVSEALRFYYKHKFSSEKQLTRDEVIKLLRKEKMKRETITSASECLDLCDLVKFAKYEANKEDFNNGVKIAKGLIE